MSESAAQGREPTRIPMGGVDKCLLCGWQGQPDEPHGCPRYRDSAAPVRLCCGQRHYGALCPDGMVMCCLCFGRFEVSDLSETVNGQKQDVCVRCAELENAG